MKNKMIIIIFLLTCYTVIISGCADKEEIQESSPNVEEIALKMQEKENSINDSSYTVYISTYTDGKTVSKNEYDIMYKKPNMKKTIEKEAGKEDLTIFDGNFEWRYDSKTNTVQKIIVPKEYQNIDTDYSQLFEEILKEFNISIVGTENIDGKKTYHFEAKPKEVVKENQSYSIDRIEIWVDTETWMPLKCEIYESTQKIEIEIKNLKINTGISDSEFKFEVPKGANVTTMQFEDLFNGNKSQNSEEIPPEGEKETALGVAV